MKLWILRHARAEHISRSGHDRDRMLSATGRSACSFLHRWLAASPLSLPERILVSPAARTLETARLALQGLATPDIERTELLWLATTTELVELINKRGSENEGLMLIGHNPGLEDLLKWMGCQLPVPGLKPGTLVIVDVTLPISQGQASVLQVVPPNESM
jgi:phosphohistidine phosphatase